MQIYEFSENFENLFFVVVGLTAIPIAIGIAVKKNLEP
jgi:hypothetical protein